MVCRPVSISDGWLTATRLHTASSISVVGLVPPGSSPPVASYSIDGLPPTSQKLASTTVCVPNQPLFDSGDLSPGPHNLTITVNQASVDQPYILDYLGFCQSSSSDAAESSTTSGTETHSKTLKDGDIVGIVLGAITLLLATAICVWMFIRRRRRRSEALGGGKFPYI